ncbi:aminotransferase class V-fold PLP-dependent enzyme [Nocardia sp. CDC159]|uniref:Kynureninase n=1 Tax=Nocardia pulmonis TaxID=2951408 RepID=A0A9X2EHQ6_9NOCA|nr:MULTISPECIES: aminotransferase class V-fold PLP-dependent enzyme [Nocardia]MCM6778276.1 aminotransferase class V-fold PLP-dependent enzyme [Nocardia pulmonis]MCM6791165.1 aminotransferase class V-fold PLP-dependent enzyme [Nocardia sp. CDC159]
MTIRSALRAEARRRDEADPLTKYAREYITDGAIHLNGNSLGPPRASLTGALDRVVSDQWAPRQVQGWFREGWLDLPRTIGDKLATLLGAAPGQVVVAGETTSTTLFNALIAACRLRPTRPVLLIEAESFPTDLYIAASVARLLDRELIVRSRDGFDAYLARHGARVAAALAAPVDFRTGARRDIGPTTARCQAAGALSVWDLSHAAGVLPVDLDAHQVDLAIGCGYKYLGGGPGAPAYLYVPARLQPLLDLPLTGWHGHARMFAMTAEFEPAPGIDRARTGTPPVLSLIALDHALDPLVEVGIEALHRRGRELGEFFLECLAERAPDLAGRLASPRDPDRRGGHLALRIPEAEPVEAALAAAGVHVDSRPPDLIRLAFAPLYVTHEQVWHAVDALDHAVKGAR